MNIVILVGHHLVQGEAMARIKALVDQVKSEYAATIGTPCEEWKGNVGKFSAIVRGMEGSATLVVESDHVRVSCELPPAAFFLKGKIEKAIRERLSNALAVREKVPVRPVRESVTRTEPTRLPRGIPIGSEDHRWEEAYDALFRKVVRSEELTDEEREWYLKYKPEHERKEMELLKSWFIVGASFVAFWVLVFWFGR